MKTKMKCMGMSAIVLVFGFLMTGCGAFSRTDKVYDYLSLAKQVGRSATGPLSLPVKININRDWDNLMSVINENGVYVNLDLSNCSIANDVFNQSEKGSDYVVSIILPNSVKEIKGNFGYFPNLETITFPASASIDAANPFAGCNKLIFKLKGKGDLSVIENGRALVRGKDLISYPSAQGDVTLNDITSVGDYAFAFCTTLFNVSLPAASAIGEGAFMGNTALETLDIPAAVSLGNGFLYGTGNTALVITLRQPGRTIGIDVFEGIWERKAITVKVPNTEQDRFVQIREAFRGRGWNGEAYLKNNVNWSVNVTVEGY